MKRSLITLLALAAFGAGCSVYQPLRDTTQPMKFKKSALETDDDWYMLSTVIDSPYEAGFTFPGEAGEMEKIRWVIEQDYLYAFRTHEFVRDSEFADSRENFLGEPVAAYRIEKHFDVWKQYNSVTGEEMPVLYEAMERPWWEREWIRVDWSSNYVGGFNWMFSEFCKMDGSIITSPVTYFPTNPGDPDQFYVAVRGTEADMQAQDWYEDFQEEFDGAEFCTQVGEWCNAYGWDRIEYLSDTNGFDYIDVINREVVSINIGPWLFGDPNTNCTSYPTIAFGGGQQITYRRSFLKKAPSEFKPVPHEDKSFERFGFFRIEREVLDPERGITDYLDYYASIWNIFENRYNADGSERPADQWTIKPITYYYIPTERLPSTQACLATGEACIDYINDDLYDVVANDWNEAYRDVLRSLGRADADDAVVFQAAPIEYNCGVSGERACQDIGDLRYSFMYNHDKEVGGSPLGYGPSFADPETGEIIAANANFYGGSLRRMSGFLGDLYDLSKGNVTEIEVMTGEDIREYYENMEHQMLPPRIPQVGLEGMEAVLKAAKQGLLDKTRNANLSFQELERKNKLEEMQLMMPRDAERRARLIGTPMEKALITPEMLTFHGFAPDVELSEDVLKRVSPLRDSSKFERHAQEWNTFWMKNNVLRAEAEAIFSDAALDRLIEWAEESLTAQNITPNRRTVVDFILRQTFRGVEAHEVGHTVGLRHNFQGSFDEENYPEDYWKIQEIFPDIEFGSINQTGDGITSTYDANGDNILDGAELAVYEADHKARKLEQERAGIDMHMTSSIMDYSRHFYYNDVLGIGRYDHAALKFGYANKVELYSNTESDFDPAEVAAAGGWANFQFRRLNRVDVDYYLGGERCMDSSECPAAGHVSVPQKCRANLGDSEVGNPVVVNGEVGGEPHYLGVCSSIYDEMKIKQKNSPSTKIYADYHFCSDERRDDRPFCNVYDEGKSAQELVENLVESYERSYIFNNFRRYKGDTFQPYYHYRRIWGSYFFPIGKLYQSLLYGYYYKDGFAENIGNGGFLDTFLASRMGMNFFAKVLATPDVGTYIKWDPSDVFYEGAYTETPESWADLYVPVGIGKHLYSRFEQGYYGEIYRYARIGNFFDKLFAIEALTTRDWGQPSANDETFPVNYYDGFQDELLTLFTGMVAEDMSSYGPVIRGVDVDPDTNVVSVSDVEFRDYWQGGFFGSDTADFPGLEMLAGSPIPYDQRYQGEYMDAGGSINVRIYALLYALLDFSVFFDATFPAYVQLYAYGRPSPRDQQAIDDGVANGDLIAFTSPDLDMTYVVPQTGDQRSVFWPVVAKAADLAAKLETYRGYASNGGAPAGFAAANQVCGKVYGIDPADPGADDECLLELTDRVESKLRSEESFLRMALDFLGQLGYATQ
ncbi:MAG: zinc-dependent metalloprotease [Deltaproteobacteria bacterium]|nr:zinc-dependent metalloprotease [Deltaproteobacteria bacterium]